MNQYDPAVDLKVNVGHCEIFLGSVILCCILKIICCMIHGLGLCDLYFIAL